MPYIDEQRRWHINIGKTPESAGELNYAITKLVHRYLIARGMSYTNINEAIGVFECAKLEMYRMIAAPYEDAKRTVNGPVSDLDDREASLKESFNYETAPKAPARHSANAG